MSTHNCDNCMGVDPETCLFALPANTFVPWEETRRKMQVLKAAERAARISEGLNERLADGDTRDKVVYGTGQNGKGSVLDADELTRLFDGDTREAHSHPAGDGCTPRCVVPSDHDTAQCGCADTRDQLAAAMYSTNGTWGAEWGEPTWEEADADLREEYTRYADAAMSVVGPKLEALRAELTSSKAAHRAVWDKHQKRGQWIFDLQGENARLRAELETAVQRGADAEQQVINMGGHKLEADDLRATIARVRELRKHGPVLTWDEINAALEGEQS